MGSSLFARHYSGSRGFFPFLRLLRCFSSPACRPVPYVFRHGHARITTRGFPHSEIPGSKVGQHLPRAYRSRPRPSSALGAKASTVCPCSLDRKEHFCCRYGVFKVRRAGGPRPSRPALRPVSQNSTAWTSRSTLFQASSQSGRTSEEEHRRPEQPAGVMAPASLERR